MLHPTHETEYRNAIDASGRPYNTVTGRITFTDDTYIDITDAILSENPVKISRQCVDNDSLMFGGVYTNVLNMNLVTDVDRYKFFGAKIELYWEIEISIQQGTDEPTYQMESVPLGIFYVTEAERPSEEINLTAYDSMTLLDVRLGSLQLSGTPWELFMIIKSMTGYDVDFTEEDLQSYPNYDKAISASEGDGLQTYRDVVKEICQMMGCFAMDNRQGKLKLKRFSKTPDIELSADNWYTMVPADYKCNYIGVSVTSKSGTYEKLDEEHPDEIGLIWDIGDAPAWDYGAIEDQELKVANLYDVIVGNEEEEIDGIEYTPASIDMPSDATFECGDMLKLLPYGADPEDESSYIYTIITSIDWNFHNGMDIESVGINPLIEGSTPSSSGTDRLVTQSIEKNKIQFLSVVNNRATTVGDEETYKLCELRFKPTAIADSLFIGTILLQANVDDDTEITSEYTEEVTVPITPYDEQSQPTVVTDINGNPVTFSGTVTNTHTHTYLRDGKCEVTIYYVLDGTRLPNEEEPYLAKETLENGKHIVTLSYPLNNLDMGHNYLFQVYITVSGGTLNIGKNAIRATLFGQQIDDISAFSGFIDVEEDPTGRFNFGVITPVALYEDDTDTGVTTIDAAQAHATDTVSLYNIASISVTPLYEGTGSLAPQIFMQGGYNLGTEDNDYFATEDGFRFITE